MTEDEFKQEIDKLLEQIEAAPMERRARFQKDLHVLLQAALRVGVIIPCEVKELDVQLTEAAIEAQFDNLPV